MPTIHPYPGWLSQRTVLFTDHAASTPPRARVGEDHFDTARQEHDRALVTCRPGLDHRGVDGNVEDPDANAVAPFTATFL